MISKIIISLLGFTLVCSLYANQKIPTTEAVALLISGKSLSLKDIQAAHKENKLKTKEPHTKVETEYVGFDLIELLNAYAEKDWKTKDGILFTALDGYKLDASVKKILKYKPMLAFRFANNKPFKIDNPNQNEKDVELAPYYLVWDNLKNPELLRSGGYDWPYQVANMDGIQYASYYAKAFPLKKASGDQKQGFEYFKTYCMTCHVVGGEGGAKGPALWPYPALFSGGLQRFSKWVIDPHSMKANTTMTKLNTELTDAEKKDVVKKIYAYLTALHKLPK